MGSRLMLNMASLQALTVACAVLCLDYARSESVTLTGNSAGGDGNTCTSNTFTFNTNFVPKQCSTLVDSDLPHLPAGYAANIATAITTNMGSSTLCIPIWGHLVISNIPDHNNYVNTQWTKLFANIVANLVDINADGTVDDVNIETKFRSMPGGYWTLARASTMTEAQEAALTPLIGKSVSVKQSEDFGASAKCEQSVASSTEEIYHTYQTVLSDAYPEIFGIKNTGSNCPASGRRSSVGRRVSFLEAMGERRVGTDCGEQRVCDWDSSKLQ